MAHSRSVQTLMDMRALENRMTTTKRKAASTTMADSERKDLILDQAAILFATKEFDGTSMRDIARLAGVSQSLIHYHYESKEQLFEAVYDRHMKEMNQMRISSIRSFLEMKNAKGDKDIEVLIGILIRPWINLVTSENEPSREFAKFVIRSAYHDDDWSRTVALKYFNEVQDLGVSAFLEIVPEFDRSMAFRAYFMMLSMFYMWLSAPKRLSDLAHNDEDMKNTDLLLRHGVTFAAAGIRALRSNCRASRASAAADRRQKKPSTARPVSRTA